MFEVAHPDITISPPETHASVWIARRAGKILAAGYQLGDLLDSLASLFERPPVRVLTVWQPYAYAIVAGLKVTEDRDWKPSWRGRLWIHAGTETDPNAPSVLWPPGRQGNPTPRSSAIRPS